MDTLTPNPTPTPPRRIGGLRGRTAVAVTGAGLLLGGLGGGLLIGHAATTSTPTPSPSSGSSSSGSSSTGSSTTAPAPGTFHPNEDPTHEAGESAQREAQENAGQVPTVP